MEFNRSLKVAQALKKEIALILQRKLNDPRLANTIITVTHVTLSNDLMYAKITINFVNEENKDNINKKIKILQNAAGYIRYLLSKVMKLRLIPRINFIYEYKNF
ncbi:MAG: 30S ribosome-binding factor RbfA [Candidatus Dasytiphilus stammeri]